MQDGRKAVWSIPYVFVVFLPSLKQNFIAYRSSTVSDCIFEIHQLRQSGFSRVYSNCCCSCSFEPEIIKIGQSSHTMYSNNILNFHEPATILNACKKCLETYWKHHVYQNKRVTLRIWMIYRNRIYWTFVTLFEAVFQKSNFHTFSYLSINLKETSKSRYWVSNTYLPGSFNAAFYLFLYYFCLLILKYLFILDRH